MGSIGDTSTTKRRQKSLKRRQGSPKHLPNPLPKCTGNESNIEQKTQPKKNNVFGDVFALIRDAQNMKYIAPVEAKR